MSEDGIMTTEVSDPTLETRQIIILSPGQNEKSTIFANVNGRKKRIPANGLRAMGQMEDMESAEVYGYEEDLLENTGHLFIGER